MVKLPWSLMFLTLKVLELHLQCIMLMRFGFFTFANHHMLYHKMIKNLKSYDDNFMLFLVVYPFVCWIINVNGTLKEMAFISEHQKYYFEEIWWEVTMCSFFIIQFPLILSTIFVALCYTMCWHVRFKDIFQEVYEKNWKEKFEEHSIW